MDKRDIIIDKSVTIRKSDAWNCDDQIGDIDFHMQTSCFQVEVSVRVAQSGGGFSKTWKGNILPSACQKH